MQLVSEIMTRDVETVAPEDTIQHVAALMDELNIGSLPVCLHGELIGMVTDRDITVRATSTGDAPGETLVREVMSTDVRSCYDDQEVDEVMEQMRDVQIRRLPVRSRQTGELVGIVSLGDLATKHSAEVDHTLERISTPSTPDRPSPGA
jgi:CBS domain-containing protein